VDVETLAEEAVNSLESFYYNVVYTNLRKERTQKEKNSICEIFFQRFKHEIKNDTLKT
jgi:hypothetical protein